MNLVTKGLSYQPSNGKVCQKYKCDHHCDMNLCWDIVSLTNKILAGNFCSRQVTVAHILAILADWCGGSRDNGTRLVAEYFCRVSKNMVLKEAFK